MSLGKVCRMVESFQFWFSDLCWVEYIFWNGKYWIAYGRGRGSIPDHLPSGCRYSTFLSFCNKPICLTSACHTFASKCNVMTCDMVSLLSLIILNWKFQWFSIIPRIKFKFHNMAPKTLRVLTPDYLCSIAWDLVTLGYWWNSFPIWGLYRCYFPSVSPCLSSDSSFYHSSFSLNVIFFPEYEFIGFVWTKVLCKESTW